MLDSTLTVGEQSLACEPESELMECCRNEQHDCLPVGRDTHSSLYNAAKPCAASVVTNFRRNADDSLTTSYVLAGSLQLTVSKSSGLSRSSSRSASCQL